MNSPFHLILGSKSPRRRELLQLLGYEFDVRAADADESFDGSIDPFDLPVHLSRRKAAAMELASDEVGLTADTVVICEGRIYNKPEDAAEARSMLSALSGRTHHVVTAFSVRIGDVIETESDTTTVEFQQLSPGTIDYYVEKFQPLDRAGGYGIQDWIGLSSVKSISGSYYTVMGLPTHLVHEKLRQMDLWNP